MRLDDVNTSLGDVNAEHAELSKAINELYGGVPTTVRAAILDLFEGVALYGMDVSASKAIVEAWAAYTSAIVLDQSTITISGASTVQLTATTTPAGNTVSWTSSNEAVATVSSSGLVTGTGNGTATITATSGDIYATCTATVSGFASTTGISAAFSQGDNVIYNVGDTLDDLEQYLTVTATYDDSTTKTVTGYTLSGNLTAGTATITVTYGEFTDTFTVVVTDFYNQTVWSDDLINVAGYGCGKHVNEAGVYTLGFSATSSESPRRTACATRGKLGFMASGSYTITDYYPVPIPTNAETVTVNIQNISTAYFAITEWTLDTSTGIYTRISDPGWKITGTTVSLTISGENNFIAVNIKSSNTGTDAFSVEPDVQITFA